MLAALQLNMLLAPAQPQPATVVTELQYGPSGDWRQWDVVFPGEEVLTLFPIRAKVIPIRRSRPVTREVEGVLLVAGDGPSKIPWAAILVASVAIGVGYAIGKRTTRRRR